MKSRKPSLTLKCPANTHAAPNEIIAEFSLPNGMGGLISIRQLEDGRGVVDVYRQDAGVMVLRRPAGLPTGCSGTPRQLEAVAKRHVKLMGPGFRSHRACIGCCSGVVPYDQGSDYCSACIKRDR